MCCKSTLHSVCYCGEAPKLLLFSISTVFQLQPIFNKLCIYLSVFAIVFKVLTKFIFVMPAFLSPVSICHYFIKQCWVSLLRPSVVFLCTEVLFDWLHNQLRTRVAFSSWPGLVLRTMSQVTGLLEHSQWLNTLHKKYPGHVHFRHKNPLEMTGMTVWFTVVVQGILANSSRLKANAAATITSALGQCSIHTQGLSEMDEGVGSYWQRI